MTSVHFNCRTTFVSVCVHDSYTCPRIRTKMITNFCMIWTCVREKRLNTWTIDVPRHIIADQRSIPYYLHNLSWLIMEFFFWSIFQTMLILPLDWMNAYLAAITRFLMLKKLEFYFRSILAHVKMKWDHFVRYHHLWDSSQCFPVSFKITFLIKQHSFKYRFSTSNFTFYHIKYMCWFAHRSSTQNES